MTALFEHYPARPEVVRAEAAGLATSGEAMLSAARDAANAAVPAATSVWGILVRPVEILRSPLLREGRTLRAAAGFAAAATNAWSVAVVLYNTTIDALNREYVEAGGNGFGVREPAPKPGQTPQASTELWIHYDDAVGVAKNAKIAELTGRKHRADETLDLAASDISGMLARGPNQGDWATLGSVGAVPIGYSGFVPGGEPGEPGGPRYVTGPPTKPVIHWDEDFIYDSKNAGWRDHLEKAKWMAKLRGGQLLRSDLDDATQMYRHYWDNDGTPIEFDYEEAYNEDPGVRRSIDQEILRAQGGAETLVNAGNTSFSMTGDASATQDYPTTENWQKTIGGHQQWSSADVTVTGSTVTMRITVHGEDHYNFNKGQADIASDAPDDANGRFTEIGWAKPFDSHGSVTRTITWELGQAPDGQVTDAGDPQRNPGREDREDERGSGDPDRPMTPDNNRATGKPRAH